MKKTQLIKTLALGLGLLTAAAQAQNYVIGTGGQSGTYYPLGGALAKVWNENIDGFNMKVEATRASVENSIKVDKGEQLVGIAMGDTVQKAFQGDKPFKGKLNLEVLFALYPNVVQIVVPKDSPIKSVADLKGKKVSLGAAGSGTRVSAVTILASLGIAEADMDAQSLDYSTTADAIANGQIDAGFITSSLGVGAITELALSRDIRILSFTSDEIAKVSEAIPAYQELDAPADIYNNVPAFKAPAVWNVLIVNKGIDEELAYQMTKAAYENMDSVQQTVKVTTATTPANATKLAGVPLNAGAKRYLDEVK